MVMIWKSNLYGVAAPEVEIATLFIFLHTDIIVITLMLLQMLPRHYYRYTNFWFSFYYVGGVGTGQEAAHLRGY